MIRTLFSTKYFLQVSLLSLEEQPNSFDYSSNKYNGVTSEEHLGDEAILGGRLCLLLALAGLLQLRPYLLYIL